MAHGLRTSCRLKLRACMKLSSNPESMVDTSLLPLEKNVKQSAFIFSSDAILAAPFQARASFAQDVYMHGQEASPLPPSPKTKTTQLEARIVLFAVLFHLLCKGLNDHHSCSLITFFADFSGPRRGDIQYRSSCIKSAFCFPTQKNVVTTSSSGF